MLFAPIFFPVQLNYAIPPSPFHTLSKIILFLSAVSNENGEVCWGVVTLLILK